VLELRRRKEDEARLDVSKRTDAVHTAQKKMEMFLDDLKELQADQKLYRQGAVDAVALRNSVSFRHKLKSDIIAQGNVIEQFKADLAQAQHALVVATQKRRAVEIVREKRFDIWHKEYRDKEQEFINDLSQQGYIRKTRTAANSAPVA
jgi:flagellar export protein FliJ